jgi:vitamin B12 transporter
VAEPPARTAPCAVRADNNYEDFMTEDKGQPRTATAIVTALCGLTALPGVSGAQSASEEPEEIVVTSSILPTPKRQIATAVSVMDGADIALRGYDSLSDALRTLPSIGVTNAGGPGKTTSLRIRGEEGYRTLLIIDGIKDLDPTGSQGGPSFDSLLATDDLTRVEVLRGPQGFMYGADAGGVVNLITGRGEDGLGGRLALEGGEFSTRKISGALAAGGAKGDFYLSATDLETDGFNSQTADSVLRDDDGAHNTTVHVKLGLNATDNLRLQLVARNIDASAQYDGCFDPVTFATEHACAATTDETIYRLSADQGSGDFTNSFGWSNVDVSHDNLTAGVSTFKTQGQIDRLEYTGSYKPSEMLAFVYGVDLQQQEVVDSSNQTLSQDQNGYYAEYQGGFHDALFVTVGARYDDNEDFGTHTSARASVAYVQQLGGGNELKYRASVGNGFRAPSLFEVAYNRRLFGVLPAALARSLEEETSQGYDLGVEYDSAAGLHLEVTYFDQDIEDAIDYTFDANSFDDGYLQSAGKSTSKGVELGVEVPLGERFTFIGNWTNNDTETATGQPRLRRPKNLGNLGLQYMAASGALRFAANYRLSSDAVDFGNTPLDDYRVLDLSAAYSVNDTFEIYGRIENAADEDYFETNGFNTAGRSVYGGLRLRF